MREMSEEMLNSLVPTPGVQHIEDILKLQTNCKHQQPRLANLQTQLQDSVREVRRANEVNHAIAVENQQLRDALIRENCGEWQWCDAVHASYGHEDLHMDMMFSTSLEILAKRAEQAFLMSESGETSLLASMFRNTWHMDNPTNTSVPAQSVPETQAFYAVCPPAGAQGECRQNMCFSPADDKDEAPSQLAGESAQQPRNMIGSRENVPGTTDHEEQISIQQPPPQTTSSKPTRMLPPGVTTIVVRNVPARLSQEQLLQLWPPDGTYDLMYLPYSYQRQRRSGLVFINMISHEAALNFAAQWHGHTIENVSGAKRLDIGVAAVQGFIMNVKHLKASNIARLRNEQFLPVAFNGTQQLDFKSLLNGLQIPVNSQRC